NVKVVTDQKADVLRIPNAALRFRPPGVESDRPAQGRPGGGGPGAARGAGLQGRVWVLGTGGKPQPVTLRVGITDGTYTEVAGDELKEQQEVIVGLGTSPERPAPSSGGPRLRL
ncbi:MAG: RND transporter, partial [Candidatus Rokuibacteriota bacterium]